MSRYINNYGDIIFLERELINPIYHYKDGKFNGKYGLLDRLDFKIIILYHREGGPAYEYYNGDKEWFYYGKLHREDGPAIELSNGHKKWFVHGERINCKSQKEFEKVLKMKAFR